MALESSIDGGDADGAGASVGVDDSVGVGVVGCAAGFVVCCDTVGAVVGCVIVDGVVVVGGGADLCGSVFWCVMGLYCGGNGYAKRTFCALSKMRSIAASMSLLDTNS